MFGSECDAVGHIRIERVIAAAQLLVGELRLADVVEQTAVLPVAGGMVVPLRDDVGRVVPVDGRHGPLDGGGDERAPGAVVMLEDDEIDVLIHNWTPRTSVFDAVMPGGVTVAALRGLRRGIRHGLRVAPAFPLPAIG